MGTDLVCVRDGVPTKLRCAKCDVGICPACLVATPVGYKCPGCAGAGAARGRRRGTGRRVTVPAVAAVVVVAALVGIALLRSPSKRVSPVSVDGPGPTTEVAPTQEAMIGEEARDGQLVFVVDGFGCEPKPTPGGKLCTLHVTVSNTSGSPAVLLGGFQYLVDAQSRTYGADQDLTRAVPENANRSIAQLNVNPGVVLPLALVYDVPAAVDPTEAQFKGTGRSRFGVNVRLQRR